MIATARRSRNNTLSLRTYAGVLTVSSALYFIRVPGVSFYIFDFVWIAGIAAFPRHFLRMPQEIYLALAFFFTATIASVLYTGLDGRPLAPMQSIIILLRFTQMAICANFFFNCARSGGLGARDFVVPALLALLIPLWGGLVLYKAAPDLAVTFNRYSSYFGNPNVLGLYVVVSTSVFLQILRIASFPKLMTFVLMLAYIVSGMYSLMLSGSNSGIILTTITIALSFTGSLRNLFFLLLASMAVFLGLMVGKEYILSSAQNMLASEFSGLKRTGLLISSLFEGFNLNNLGSQTYRTIVEANLFYQQFSDIWRVFLGLGPGQSKLLTYALDGNMVTIHNFYKWLFLEFGLLGTISFALLAFLTFRRCHWNYQTFLLFSGFLFASSGTPALYLPFFWAPLFSALAGLTVHYGNQKNRSNGLESATT